MSSTNQPFVTVVIPTLNEDQNISNLLKALNKQTYQPLEIIVVDAHSQDDTQKIVKTFNDVLLTTANKPVGNQRNQGGKAARGELIFFMDADVSPNPTFISQSIRRMLQRRIQLACPWTYPKQSTLTIQLIFLFFNSLFWLFQWWKASGGGMCLIVKKTVFLQTGGFNSRLKFEDIEFIRRASKFGKFRMIPVTLAVSDRRFKTDGTFVTLVKYLILGIFFCLGLFKFANIFEYQFGHYTK